MSALRRIRWFHTVGFYAVLLLVITAVSYAVRSPAARSAPLAQSPSGPAAAATAAPSSATPPSVARMSTTMSSPRPKAVSRRRFGVLDYNAAGIVLPDRKTTPGAVNPRVTQADINSTICVSGWTSTVRPDSSYTTALKVAQLDAGYNFRGDTATSDYEEDHLISLELGGSSTSIKNLWPEPYTSAEGARVKDRIENKLRELVCARAISLRTAQHAIATDWWLAYQRYIAAAPTAARPTHTYTPPPPPTRTYTPPPPPVQLSCTTTSSGTCIRGGEFCPQASYGQTGYDASGDAYVCTGDATHPHWET